MLRLSLLFCALVLLASAFADPSQFDTSDPLPSMPSGSEHMPHHSDPAPQGSMPHHSDPAPHGSMPHHSGDPLPPMNSESGQPLPPMNSESGQPLPPMNSESGQPLPPMNSESGQPMPPQGSTHMPGPNTPTTHSPTTTSTPTTTAASGTPAPTFSQQERDDIKQKAETIINSLPANLNFTVIGETTVSDKGVVALRASFLGGCTYVTSNKSQFEGNEFNVSCVDVQSGRRLLRLRRLLAASTVDLTFTPKQGPTYAPATTPSTDSPASATVPSALAFLAVVVAAIAF